MSESREPPIVESANLAYDRLHQLALEEEGLLEIHKELHDELAEAQASEANTQKKILELCAAIAGSRVNREQALERIEALHRTIETRTLQMEQIKKDIVTLRALEDDLDVKLREAARVILPEAKA